MVPAGRPDRNRVHNVLVIAGPPRRVRPRDDDCGGARRRQTWQPRAHAKAPRGITRAASRRTPPSETFNPPRRIRAWPCGHSERSRDAGAVARNPDCRPPNSAVWTVSVTAAAPERGRRHRYGYSSKATTGETPGARNGASSRGIAIAGYPAHESGLRAEHADTQVNHAAEVRTLSGSRFSPRSE